MNKFKVGDKVRLKKDSEFYGKFNQLPDTGEVIEIEPDSWLSVKWDGGKNSYKESDLVSEEKRDLIVHCPTEELWNRVQEKMFEFTEWIYDGKEISNSWAEYGFNIIYSLKENNYKMLRGYKEYFNQTNYPDTPIISAEEYLGIEVAEVIDVPYDLPISNRCTEATLSSKNLQNAINYLTNQDSNKSLTKKTMSIVKSTFQSKESKAVAHFGLGENKNNLCRDGLWEFLQYLYETEADKKKDFLALLVKKQKEEKE